MRNILAAALLSLGLASAAHAADIPPGASTGARVTPGVMTPGVFEYPGDTDAWQVRLEKGVDYGIYVASGCHAKRVRLYNAGFKLLATATITPPNPPQAAWLEWQPTYTGKHFIQVTELPQPGSSCAVTPQPYYLSAFLTCLTGKTTKCTLSPVGPIQFGYIHAANDREWYKFTIATTGTYTLSASPGEYGDWYAEGVLSLRRADTSIISESNRADAYQCIDPYYECLRARLTPGTYYIALRMPDVLEVTQYQISLYQGG